MMKYAKKLKALLRKGCCGVGDIHKILQTDTLNSPWALGDYASKIVSLKKVGSTGQKNAKGDAQHQGSTGSNQD